MRYHARRVCLSRLPAHALKHPHTNNIQEHANSEIKRRLRMTQVFPSKKSLLRFTGAVVCDYAEMKSGSRYFSKRKMTEVHGTALRDDGPGERD